MARNVDTMVENLTMRFEVTRLVRTLVVALVTLTMPLSAQTAAEQEALPLPGGERVARERRVSVQGTDGQNASENITPANGVSRSRYIMVLKPGPEEAPDVPGLGGNKLAAWKNRVAIEIPDAALQALSEHPRVHYLQKVLAPGEIPINDQNVSLSSTIGPSSEVSAMAASWQSGTYQYDGAGNIIHIGSQYFVYDTMQRLARASVRNGSSSTVEEYEYDGFANMKNRRSTQAGGLATEAPIAVSSATNKLTTVTYDAAGNVTNDGTFLYTWNALGRMTSSQRIGGVTTYYVYDASGERIGIQAPDGTWRWTLRGLDGKVLREYESNADGTQWLWIEDHVYRGGQVVASERVAAEGGRRHFHLDHLGSPRMVTNQAGQILAKHDFTPFGLELTSIRQEVARGYEHEDPMRFTGHERDFNGGTASENGEYLDYMHARYYKAGLGRFLSVDPSEDDLDLSRPQTWNKYAYVQNNPISKVDPDGRGAMLVTAGVGALENAGFQIAINVVSGRPWSEGVVREMAVGAAVGLTGVGVVALSDKGVDAYRAAKAAREVSAAADDAAGAVGRGMQNPKVAAAVRRGQEAHKAAEYPAGFTREVRLPSGKKMDAYNSETKQVIELKPDNAKAIKRGEQQVKKYCKECDQVYGPGHTSTVQTYKP